VIPVVLGTTTLFLGLLFWRAGTTEKPVSIAALTAIAWLAVGVYLLFGRVRTRADVLELALPIPARQLWRRHFSSVLLGGALIAGLSGAVVAGFYRLLRAQYALPPLGGTLVFQFVLLLVGSLLAAVALLEGFETQVREVGFSWRVAGRTLAVVLAILGLLVWLGGRHPTLAIVPLLLGTALAIRAERRVPRVYSLIAAGVAAPSRAAQRADSRALGRKEVGRLGALLGVWATLEQSPKFGRASSWLTYPLILGFGMITGGALDMVLDSLGLRYFYIPLIPYMLLAFVAPRTGNLRRLDPLPLSRRTILGLLVLPSLVAVVAGYGLGDQLARRGRATAELVEYRVDLPYYWTRVPGRFMGLSPSGEVPQLSASNGESHQAWSVAPVAAGDTVVYSPFNTTAESSARFEAEMLSRAIARVYGAEIAAEELLERYFVVDGERVTGLRNGEFRLRRDYPDLEMVDRNGPFLPLILIAAICPGLLMLAILFRTQRLEFSERLRQWVLWGMLAAVLIGAVVSQVVFAIAGLFEPDEAAAAIEIVICDLGRSPIAVGAVWFAAVVLLALCYRIAEGQFRRVEIGSRPSIFTVAERFCLLS
jgi:hypothetical protein